MFLAVRWRFSFWLSNFQRWWMVKWQWECGQVWGPRMFLMEAVIASKAARNRPWWIEDHTILSKFIGSGGSESELVRLFHWYSISPYFTGTQISLSGNYLLHYPLFSCTLPNILVSLWNMDDSGEILSIYSINIKWHVESPSDMVCLQVCRSLREFLTPDC